MSWPRSIALGVLIGFLAVQLIPYGHGHPNPKATATPRWDSARTEQLFAGACGDCHSNRTSWPWYSNVAPVSWLVRHDVDEGRGAFNVSHWDQPQPDAGEVTGNIESGAMPLGKYKLIHGAARLSQAEKDELIRGIERTWSADPPGR
jgi:mono/diheme cytochrome c family protein